MMVLSDKISQPCITYMDGFNRDAATCSVNIGDGNICINKDGININIDKRVDSRGSYNRLSRGMLNLKFDF